MSFELKVLGMSCNHCVASVQNAVAAVSGVTAVEVDLLTGIVKVDGIGVDKDKVIAAIEQTGFDVM